MFHGNTVCTLAKDSSCTTRVEIRLLFALETNLNWTAIGHLHDGQWMASFDYNYQNPSVCSFLVKISAIVV